MPVNVLIVEDDPDIVTVLEHHLAKEGYGFESAQDGRSAKEKIARSKPDLILLDLMLPELSGLEILKLLRGPGAISDAKVIVLTARKEEIDRVLAFELGADDYVTKPFSPRELMLRVRAVLKRSERKVETDEPLLRSGPIEVAPNSHRAWVEGHPVRLTLTEFRLLTDLMRARGRVRSRESLLSELWGYDADVMSRTVDTHIRRLRDKLGKASTWLITVRGVGYRIQDPAVE
jgi:two-component system phosphate regulon response regulator PhoB